MSELEHEIQPEPPVALVEAAPMQGAALVEAAPAEDTGEEPAAESAAPEGPPKNWYIIHT